LLLEFSPTAYERHSWDPVGCWRYFDFAQHSGTPTTTSP
jgi:hypothetical protein